MISLDTILAAALRYPEVAQPLRNALTSDLVVSSTKRRRVAEFACSFLEDHGQLPGDGDWELWLDGLPEDLRAGCKETLGKLGRVSLDGLTPSYVADRAVEELRKAAARTALYRQNQVGEENLTPEILAKLADEVQSVRPEGTVAGLTRALQDQGAVSLARLAEEEAAVADRSWDLAPYTAPGLITLLAAAPKAGKSTLMGHYAHAKVTGAPFLGQELDAAPVLLAAPDEAWVEIVRRQQWLGTPGEDLYVWVGPAPTVPAIARKAEEIGAGLVIVDTIGRVAGIQDENDNAAWINWWSKADPYIRGSSSSWCFVHHTRKGGGTHGEAIRGASALFGSVDIAISLHRHPEDFRQRIVRVEGSRLEWAEDLVIELSEDDREYRALGDYSPPASAADDQATIVHALLAEAEGLTANEIDEKLAEQEIEIPRSRLYKLLERLVETGQALRRGEGVRGDPYSWISDSSHSSRPPLREEREQSDTTPESEGKTGVTGTGIRLGDRNESPDRNESRDESDGAPGETNEDETNPGDDDKEETWGPPPEIRRRTLENLERRLEVAEARKRQRARQEDGKGE